MNIKYHDKIISIPNSRSVGRTSLYKWESLEVNKCFDILCEDLPSPKYRPDAPARLKKTGYRTLSRKVCDADSAFKWVIRTWRVN